MCKVLEDMRYESWQEGVREGIQKEKKDTTISLAKMGLPIDKIAQVVKISTATVQKWINENACVVR